MRVTALQVFEANIPQFLQVNPLGGSQRAGPRGPRVVAQDHSARLAGARQVDALRPRCHRAHAQAPRRPVPAHAVAGAGGRALRLSRRAPKPRPTPRTRTRRARKTATANDHSNWDYYEEDITTARSTGDERDDPCKPAYYRYGRNIRAQRNLLASNIGLIAKRAQRGKLLAVATALDTREAALRREDRRHELPEPGHGQRPHRQRRHAGARSARHSLFALIADDGGRKGYLRVAQWRRAARQPLRRGRRNRGRGTQGISLRRPRRLASGRLHLPHLRAAGPDQDAAAGSPGHRRAAQSARPAGADADQLHARRAVLRFRAQDRADAPTGDWNALAHRRRRDFRQDAEGGDRDAQPAQDRARSRRQAGHRKLSAQGHCQRAVAHRRHRGQPARRDRSAAVDARATRFTRNADYVFDDPARGFSGAPITVYDGELDADGKAKIEKDLDLPRDVPGMLNATFITRVFERGGAFSINRETRTVAAFDRYVGLQAAQGRRGARHAAHRHQARGGTRHAGRSMARRCPSRACRSRSTRCSGAGGGTRAAIRWRSTRRAKAPP